MGIEEIATCIPSFERDGVSTHIGFDGCRSLTAFNDRLFVDDFITDDKLERIEQSNSMRGSDRTTLAQQYLVEMNQDFSLISPQDPRERGAERYEFINGREHMTDTNGFDELAKRKELNEDH